MTGLLIVTLVGGNAGAEPVVSFTATFPDGTRTATVKSVGYDGVVWVSLSVLVEQLGGACSVLPARVQVDLGGGTAWMKLNDTAVNASLGSFALRQPLRKVGNEVWMAQEDIAVFFQEAFRIPVKQETILVATSPSAPGDSANSERLKGLEPSKPSAAIERLTPEPLNSPVSVIIVDPGHGGSDSGCVGSSGLKEKDLALAVSRKLQEMLRATTNASVLLTRTEDVDVPLAARAAFAEKNGGGLFVSIHGGASFSRLAHGSEVFSPSANADAYPQRESSGARHRAFPPLVAQVRRYAAESLALGRFVAAALAQGDSQKNRGVRTVPCRVLRDIPMPGVMIEIGCLTNPSEEALLGTDSYQQSLAQEIAQGITNYLSSYKTGTSLYDGR